MATAGAALAGLGVTSLANDKKFITLQDKYDALKYKKDLTKWDPLITVCWRRARWNGRYRPGKQEMASWIRAIIEHDKVLRDPVLYCAQIEQESSWDPTLLRPEDGNTRGLGSVKYTTAKEIVERYKMKVKAVGTALWNPRFNILCMVKCMERLYSGSLIENRLLWAHFCYNAGMGTAKGYIKRGENIPEDYHMKVMKRYETMKAEMKEVRS